MAGAPGANSADSLVQALHTSLRCDPYLHPDMTPLEPSKETAPTPLSTLARTFVIISAVLAVVLFGRGLIGHALIGVEDSSWIQIAIEVAAPALLLLCTGYVYIEDSES